MCSAVWQRHTICADASAAAGRAFALQLRGGSEIATAGAANAMPSSLFRDVTISVGILNKTVTFANPLRRWIHPPPESRQRLDIARSNGDVAAIVCKDGGIQATRERTGSGEGKHGPNQTLPDTPGAASIDAAPGVTARESSNASAAAYGGVGDVDDVKGDNASQVEGTRSASSKKDVAAGTDGLGQTQTRAWFGGTWLLRGSSGCSFDPSRPIPTEEVLAYLYARSMRSTVYTAVRSAPERACECACDLVRSAQMHSLRSVQACRR